VEAALIDESCFLEVVGVRAVLSVAELCGNGDHTATPADLTTIDQLLRGAAPDTRPNRELMMLRLIAGRLGAFWR
jgi:hypothetical protein